MKKIFYLFTIIVLANSVFAQVPFEYNGIYYVMNTESTVLVSESMIGTYDQDTIVIDSIVYNGAYEYRVVGMDDNAMYNCEHLVDITLPKTIDSIGNECFKNCIQLKSIHMQHGITKIGDEAFFGCYNLEEIAIPSSVETIGNSCFGGNGPGGEPTSLQRIFMHSSEPADIAPSIVADIAAEQLVLYVPADALDIYKTNVDYINNFNTILPFSDGLVNIRESIESDSVLFTWFKYPDVEEYHITIKLGDEVVAEFSVDAEGKSTRLLAPPRRAERNDTTKSSTEMFVISLSNLESGSTYNYSVDGSKKVNGQSESVYRTSGTFRIGGTGIEQVRNTVYTINYYSISLKSSNPLLGSVAANSNRVEQGTNVKLTATPAFYSVFIKWSDGNTDNPRIITVNEDISLTALFELPSYDIQVVANNPAMGSVTGSGSYSAGSMTTLTAIPNEHYRFVKWSDEITLSTREILVTTDYTYTAIFEPIMFTISASVNDADMGSVSGAGEHIEGSIILLTATPEEHYRFVKWSDNETKNPRSVTVTANAGYTAVFEPIMFTVSTGVNDADMGSVSGAGEFIEGSKISLVATPAEHHRFVKWTDGSIDNPRSVTVTANETFTAVFEPIMFTVSSSVNDAGMGSVSGAGEFIEGSKISLVATPSEHYKFVKWNDGNTDNPRSVTVTADETFTAVFEPIMFKVSASVNDANMGSVSGAGEFIEGSKISLVATPAEHHKFVKWNDGNTDNPRSITVTNNAEFTAVFEPIMFTVSASVNDADMGSVSGAGEFIEGSKISLTAIPADNYQFVKWSDNNTDNPRLVSVTTDAIYTAIFEIIPPNYYSIVAIPADNKTGVVTGSGSYEENSKISLIATPAEHYRFVKWDDGNTDNPRSVTVTANEAFIAVFEPIMFTITANVNDPDMGHVSGAGTGKYIEGSKIAFTATPAEHYRFVKWNDGNTDNPRSVTVTADETFTAVFEPIMFTVSASVNDAGMGSVSGAGEFIEGSKISLVATPAEHHRFVKWTDGSIDNPRSVTVTANETFTAVFEPIMFTVSASVNDAGMGSVSGAGEFIEGSKISLVATPAEHHKFVKWNDGNTDNPHSVTVTANETFTAVFEPIMFTVSASVNDAGMGSVSGAGEFIEGSKISLVATPAEHHKFVKWDDGNTDNPRPVTVTADETFTAIFEPIMFTITSSVNDAGMGSVSGAGEFIEGSKISLVATPAEHHKFVKWNDGNTDNPRSVTVTANETFTAVFEPIMFTVSASVNDAGMGSVRGAGEFIEGSKISLVATPAEHHRFVKWTDGNTDNPRSVTVTADETFTAVFEPIMFTITASVNDAEMGSVSGAGEFIEGSVIELEALPKDNFYFVEWSDGNTDNPRSVSITADAEYTAVFEAVPPTYYTITVSVEAEGTGEVTGSGTYKEGETVLLTAIPAEGYKFEKWSDGNTDNPRSVVIESDLTLTALFELETGLQNIFYTAKAQKVLINGKVYILKDGKVYDLRGNTLKK